MECKECNNGQMEHMHTDHPYLTGRKCSDCGHETIVEDSSSKYFKDMTPNEVCISEIKRLRKVAQSLFELIVKECEHYAGPLCLSRDEALPRKGIVFCKVENCPLV